MARSPFPIPVFDHSAEPNVGRMPAWVRQSLAGGNYADTAATVRSGRLHTVCEEARCPNRGECWSKGTATFMLLGDTCTRACGFCAVKTGRPSTPEPDEPRRVAEAVTNLLLDYVVLTSVNRDDLPDGGAGAFADTLIELRTRLPRIAGGGERRRLGLEILTPDFRGVQEAAVARIVAAVEGERLVFGHNVETVPALYRTVRKGANYERSLRLLELAAAQAGIEAKSAIMLGLGEPFDEVLAVMRDLRSAGVSRLALGQYLRPSRYHLPVREYVHPDAFARYEAEARALGFNWVQAGPMVRSSYHAEERVKEKA